MLGLNTITFEPRSGVAARAVPPKTSAATTSVEAAATVLQRCLGIPSSFLRWPSGELCLFCPIENRARLDRLELLERLPAVAAVAQRAAGRRAEDVLEPGVARAP